MVAVNADALVRLTRAVLPAISPTPLRYRLPLWSPTTATAIADRLGLAAPQAATGLNAPTVVASAINIPADFGHHAWVIDIQPHVSVPQR